MLTIYNGRDALWQWDSGQRLIVPHGSGCEVHYKNPGEDMALVVNTYELDGQTVADIPNILLQRAGELTAYVYVCMGDACTIDKTVHHILPRPKPADYVYTETEIKTYAALEERIAEIEKNGVPGGGGGSGGSSNVYVGTEAPPEDAEVWIDPEAALLPDEIPSIRVEQTENGAIITATSLDGVTTATIKNGKDGEPGYTPVKGKDYFDGEPGYTPQKGVDYFDGAPGKTPIKGTDYYTEADKAEMVASVKASLKSETWQFTLSDGSTVEKTVMIG